MGPEGSRTDTAKSLVWGRLSSLSAICRVGFPACQENPEKQAGEPTLHEVPLSILSGVSQRAENHSSLLSRQTLLEADERGLSRTQTWQSNLNFWRHRDRRCLVTNRYYRWVRSSEASGYAVTDLDKQTVAVLLRIPTGLFDVREYDY